MQAMLPEANTASEARDAEFRAVALPHLPSIARLARALVPQQADADDLVQETFLRAYLQDVLRAVSEAAGAIAIAA